MKWHEKEMSNHLLSKKLFILHLLSQKLLYLRQINVRNRMDSIFSEELRIGVEEYGLNNLCQVIPEPDGEGDLSRTKENTYCL